MPRGSAKKKPVVDPTITGGAGQGDLRKVSRMTYERRKKAKAERHGAANSAKTVRRTRSGEAAGKRTDSGAASRSESTPNPGRTGQGPTAGSWQPGQSGNPKGAPRRGESWREMVKMVGDRTLAEALERYPWLADKIPERIRPYATVNDTLTLKEVVVANVFGKLLEEPDSALWNGLMNRAEGNPEQPVERTWKAELAEWLRDGKVSLDEIKGRLSDELFAEFVVYVGAAIPGNR